MLRKLEITILQEAMKGFVWAGEVSYKTNKNGKDIPSIKKAIKKLIDNDFLRQPCDSENVYELTDSAVSYFKLLGFNEGIRQISLNGGK